MGHTALPTELSPEPPSGVSNHTGEEGKQRTGPGPRGPIRFRRNTSMVAPWTRAPQHPRDSFPRPLRSPEVSCGVCLSRPRACSVQGEPARARPPRAPPRAPLLQPLRCRRELGATASDCGGVKPRRRSRVSVAGPGKPGAPRGPRESTFESTRNEDGSVSFVGTANAVMYACTRMAEWLRRWT